MLRQLIGQNVTSGTYSTLIYLTPSLGWSPANMLMNNQSQWATRQWRRHHPIRSFVLTWRTDRQTDRIAVDESVQHSCTQLCYAMQKYEFWRNRIAASNNQRPWPTEITGWGIYTFIATIPEFTLPMIFSSLPRQIDILLTTIWNNTYRVAQNRIPHRRICNISATNGLILKNFEAA